MGEKLRDINRPHSQDVELTYEDEAALIDDTFLFSLRKQKEQDSKPGHRNVHKMSRNTTTRVVVAKESNTYIAFDGTQEVQERTEVDPSELTGVTSTIRERRVNEEVFYVGEKHAVIFRGEDKQSESHLRRFTVASSTSIPEIEKLSYAQAEEKLRTAAQKRAKKQ